MPPLRLRRRLIRREGNKNGAVIFFVFVVFFVVFRDLSRVTVQRTAGDDDASELRAGDERFGDPLRVPGRPRHQEITRIEQ
jgi:hypothetical protein